MAESIAFITGGDRGLGFSLCKGLLARGWRVFAGQYMHEWTDLDGLVKLYPQLLTPIALDVTVQDSVQAAASEVAKLADHVDVLINNAGVISMGTNERTIRDGQDYGEL